MGTIKTESIGLISLTALGDLTTSQNLQKQDTIFLHQNDFDRIVLEHRHVYGYSLELPFKINEVLIEQDPYGRVLRDKVGLLLDDDRPERYYEKRPWVNEDYDSTRTVYRCGWCGNIVSAHGEMLEIVDWNKDKKYLDANRNARTKDVDGYCCRDNPANH